MNEDSKVLPQDHYSIRLRELKANPAHIEKVSMIDIDDFYGNAETWIVRTVRVETAETVFVQRIHAAGGERSVLPPDITRAIARQRAGAVTVNRRRGAAAGVATRLAKGTMVPPPRPRKAASKKRTATNA